jgi:hypothetical protein
MELKNAVTICLISFFSATLVVLIARSLDVQAVTRLEPQLARIAEELEALRTQGGIQRAGATDRTGAPASDGLIVYYLHGKTRCPTCRAIESQAHEVVQSQFASELQSGAVTWKVVNYEEPSGAEFAKKFEIQMPVVVLARMKGGDVAHWKRLDRVWALFDDKPAYASYLRDEISQMVRMAEPQPTLASSQDEEKSQESVVVPADKPASPPIDLPIPE